MIYALRLSIIMIFILSGCTNLNTSSPKKLQKNVQNLKPQDKKLIYRTIKKEIAQLKHYGDENYEDGYYYNAITAYEKVNFYEGKDVIPASKINHIKKIAKEKSIKNYKKLKEHTKKDKKQTLSILNQITMYNPNYKDTKQLMKEVKKDREIQIFLNKLTSELYSKIANNKNTINDLLEISKAYKELVKYDYQNPSLKQAKETLKKEHKNLINEAKRSYNQGNLNTAKKKFTTITLIYKDDKTAKRYLYKIKNRKNINTNLKNAKRALDKRDYTKAIALSKQILKIEPNNKKAKEIKIQAKKDCNKEVSKLISDGIKNYGQKNLDKAQKNFQRVLKLKPDNSTALIYTKKIHRQLQTIKSLQL